MLHPAPMCWFCDTTKAQWTHSLKSLPFDQPMSSRGQTETFPKDICSPKRKHPCWTSTVLKKHSQTEKQRLRAKNSCYTHPAATAFAFCQSPFPFFFITKWNCWVPHKFLPASWLPGGTNYTEGQRMSSQQLHCSEQVPVHIQGDRKGPGWLRMIKGRGCHTQRS